jgi:hypothetical protein
MAAGSGVSSLSIWGLASRSRFARPAPTLMPQSIALRIGRRYGSAVAPLSTFHPEFYLSFRNPPPGRSARQSLFHGTFDLTYGAGREPTVTLERPLECRRVATTAAPQQLPECASRLNRTPEGPQAGHQTVAIA